MQFSSGRRLFQRLCQREVACFATASQGEAGVDVYRSVTGSVPAWAFDVDGVLLRGSKALPAALEAMKLLFAGATRPQFPFVFMTNGGGESEARRADILSEKLDIPVHPSQVILSHTTMQEMLPDYADKAVLVSGRHSSLHVARAYGFGRAVSTQQLSAAYGAPATPFSPISRVHDEDPCPVRDLQIGTEADPIRAVLVLTDPDDWYRDLQLISDTVISRGVPGRRFAIDRGSDVQVVFSQNDLLWANDHHSPRFGLGAFARALEALCHAATDEPIRHKVFHGKPTLKPYRLAERLLQQQLDNRALEHANAKSPPAGGQVTPAGMPRVGPIYMVGDNPRSDIHGANDAGAPWRSVLVRTGVWQGTEGENDALHPAHFVVDNVLDAVKLGLHAQHIESR